jgi:PAS domain S-box-containing protein
MGNPEHRIYSSRSISFTKGRPDICFVFLLSFFSFYLQSQTYLRPPVIIPAGEPEVIHVPVKSNSNHNFLDKNGHVITITLTPPQKISFAALKKDNGEVIKDRTGKPFILGEGGLSNFTNYTTDDGLALDVTLSSYMDHWGNLWFGTSGGGVSRYDGKSFTNFTTAHGLGNNSIWAIIEDRKGNMWFGTNSGLSKYNGKRFTNYSAQQGLTNSSVWSIAEDRKGNLWIGTNGGGIFRFDGKSFINYTTKQGLPHDVVSSIIEDKSGTLWFGTMGGLARFDPVQNSFENYTEKNGLINDMVWDLFEDKAGNIWIASDGDGVSCYNPQNSDGKISVSNYTTADGIANNSVWKIRGDKNGNIWMGTSNGVSLYDGKKFVSYTKQLGLAGKNVWNIVEDREGNMWFGTDDSGISRYNGKAFTSYTTDQGLLSNTIWSICEDKKDGLWFATNSGLSQYSSKSNALHNPGFTNYTAYQGLPDNQVWTVLEDKKGNIWIGTYVGLSCFNGESFTNYYTEQGLVNNVVTAILEDENNVLWIGTNGGLSRFDKHTFTNYTEQQGLINNTIKSIHKDKKGNIWLGTEKGLSQLILPSGQGLPKNNTEKIEIRNYTMQQGLAGNSVTAIAEDKTGNIWFATDNGLSRFDGKSFLNFNKSQGLHDNIVIQVDLLPCAKDNQKQEQCLVLGTNLGIAILTGWKDKEGTFYPGININTSGISNDDLKNYTPNFEIYNSETGYPVKDVNIGQHAMFVDSKGIIWIATGAAKTALVRFDPSALNRNTQPLTLNIQSIKINEENISWNYLKNSKDSILDPARVAEEISTFDALLTKVQHESMLEKFSGIEFDSIAQFYPVPVNLVLPYANNNITFDFSAIKPARAHLVKYQYILEGYSNEWSPLTNKTSATFGNISEGNYTFRLKALSPEGIWSSPVSYSFRVLPPLYRTWWAYTLYAIAVSGLLFATYRWRTVSLRRDKEQLEQTVKMRTEEIVKQNMELEKLSIVASETDNGVLICGPGGEIEWANEGLTKLLGYTFEELKQKGKTIEELSSNPDIKDVIKQSIKNKKTSTYQALNHTKDGHERWTQSTLTPILDEKGEIKKLVVIDTDISERKKIEEQLNKKNHELEQSNKTIVILSEIGQKITSTLSIEKIVEKTYGSINRLMDADIFCIGIPNRMNNTIEFPGFLEKGEKFDSEYDLNDDTRLPVLCFKHKYEICINDFEKEYQQYIPFIPPPIAGEQPESIIYLPLLFNNKVIGVVNVSSFRKNAYTAQHLNILKNLAVYIAIGIQNAELYENLEEMVRVRTAELMNKKEEIERTYNNIQILSEIGQEITSTLNLEKILDTVYKKVNSLMDATIFGIGIYDEARQCIEYKLAVENGKKYEVYLRDMNNKNQFPVWCIDNQKAVFINNVYEEYSNYISSYEVHIKKLEDGNNEAGHPQSMIYLPIQLKERVIGVIAVQSPKKDAYTHNHLEILQTLASYIAIALDNAHLYDNMEEEIKARTKEIEKQKVLVEEKNLKITDSISYALRIQQAILPSQQMMSSVLPDSFIFFKPKDIVSGDFYWAHAIDQHEVLFAAVDCTGHGVPGAFMSIMGYNLLEQIVKEQQIHEPGKILDELSSSVVRALKQTGQLGSIKEGMDIALCKLNYRSNELEYAGAHNPLTMIRNNTITEIKANRRSIGISSASPAPFINHKVQLQKGDCIYIFSDGFADQKGGPANQKFFYQPFRDLLVSIHQQNMQTQENLLEQTMNDWKNGQEQIDDMLVIGVRV